MRRVCSVILLLILLTSTAPLVNADSKGTIICTNADLDMMPANWNIQDQSCVRIALGQLEPGVVLSFDISTDTAVDILLFTANGIEPYQNEQNYRSNMIWEYDSVFESFNGDGSWHWTVPDDRQMTHWYLVIDNLAHPQDSGEGSQGGSVAQVTMDAAEVTSPAFPVVDTIVRLEASEHEVAAGPFVLDAGTLISIQASTMEGAPDIFLMTETQKEAYEEAASQNLTAASRINSADLLAVTSTGSTVWTVTTQYEGTPLYLLVDNRAGGGGAGTSAVATTVMSELTPILDPILSDASSLDIVDVGSLVTLDASTTPNSSNQILRIGWDTNEDGVDDTVGEMVNVTWPTPNNITIRLTAVSTDGRSSSIFKDIEVKDISPPQAEIDVNADIRRAFGETLVLSGDFSDNWGVSSVEWLIDDIVISSYLGSDSDADTFTQVFDSSFVAGAHSITLRVTDFSGMVSEDTAILDLYDSTPPLVSPTQLTEMKIVVGQLTEFSVDVSDAETTNLVYSWDFDGDGFEDKAGPLVIHSFADKGTQWVRCTVTNDAGLSTEINVQVQIISDADDSGGLSLTILAAIIVASVAILGLGGYLIWRGIESRKIAKMIAEAEAAEAAEKVVAQPSVEEQKAMWGGGGITQPSAFQQPSASAGFGSYSSGMSGLPTPPPSGQPTAGVGAELDPDLAELMATSPPPTGATDSSPANDLLAAFEEDDAVAREEVEYKFDDEDVTSANEGVWSPSQDEISALPSPPIPETVVEPPAPTPEPEQIPEPDSALTEDLPDESPQIDDSRNIRQTCSNCEKMFEVDMPEGVDVARTACPHCESIETVRIS